MKNYASRPENCKGYVIKDQCRISTNNYINDIHKISTSKSFRRLKEKKQAISFTKNDHFRNRLTHSVEVGAISKIIANILDVNENLAEATGLVHDIGHPPFGHQGEAVLHKIMQKHNSYFDHNINTFKTATLLENAPSVSFGINLCHDVLDATLKHNGLFTGKTDYIDSYNKRVCEKSEDLIITTNTHCSMEGQIAAIADDISYVGHDFEDAIRYKLKLDDFIDNLEFVKNIYDNIKKTNIKADIKNIKLFMQKAMIDDVVKTTQHNIDKYSIETAQDIKLNRSSVVHCSVFMNDNIRKLKQFLLENYYSKVHTYELPIVTAYIENVFFFFMNSPEMLPQAWNVEFVTKKTEAEKASLLCDFISGMTDKYLVECSQKLLYL